MRKCFLSPDPLLKTFDPETLCGEQLKICPHTNATLTRSDVASSMATGDLLSTDVHQHHARDNPIEKLSWCVACVASVEELDKMLASEPIDREIAVEASRVCAAISGRRKQQVRMSGTRAE